MLSLSLLLACAHSPLQPMALPIHLERDDPPAQAAPDGFATISLESYAVAEDARGAHWAGSWHRKAAQVLGGGPSERQAIYALVPPGASSAWTWSSPPREGWGEIDLGVGEGLDLVVERRGEPGASARWVAIDPERRRVAAQGALPGARCGVILADEGGGFLLSSGGAVGRLDPAQGRFEAIIKEPGALCLRGRLRLAGEDHLLWAREDGALRLGAVDGGEARTIPWPGPGERAAPLQVLRAIEDPDGGGFWLFWAVDGARTTPPDPKFPPGIYAARVSAAGEVGAPVFVSAPSAARPSRSKVPGEADAPWEVVPVDGRLVVVVASGPSTRRAAPSVGPVATKPDWTLVRLPSEDAPRVTLGADGPALWSTTWGPGGKVWTWRAPLPARTGG